MTATSAADLGPHENIGFDILTVAIREMGEAGMTRTHILPSLIDFTAAVAIAMGGEEVLRACVVRISDRIDDFREGTFPVTPPP